MVIQTIRQGVRDHPFAVDSLELLLKAPFVGRIGTLVSGSLLAAASGVWLMASRR